MVAKKDEPKEEIDFSALCVNDDVDEINFNGLALKFKRTPKPSVINAIITKRGISNDDLVYGILEAIVTPTIPRDLWFDEDNGISLTAKAKIWSLCEEYAGLNVNNFRGIG